MKKATRTEVSSKKTYYSSKRKRNTQAKKTTRTEVSSKKTYYSSKRKRNTQAKKTTRTEVSIKKTYYSSKRKRNILVKKTTTPTILEKISKILVTLCVAMLWSNRHLAVVSVCQKWPYVSPCYGRTDIWHTPSVWLRLPCHYHLFGILDYIITI